MNDAAPLAPAGLTILVLAMMLALALLALGLGLVALRQRARLRSARERHRQAIERADAAARAADTFFDLVTHELRSPLAAILGYQELLRDGAYGQIGDGAADAVDRMGRSARHLLHLIDGVVEIGRLRSGNVRPRIETVDLPLVVHMAAEAFRTHAAERHIPCSVRIDHDLPVVRSDQERLVRALDLMVVSAVKYPGKEPLAFHAERHDDGATIHIHGAAIPVRTDSDDSVRRLGMRIAAAMGIAELLGGTLHMDASGTAPIASLAFRIRDLDPATFDAGSGAG